MALSKITPAWNDSGGVISTLYFWFIVVSGGGQLIMNYTVGLLGAECPESTPIQADLRLNHMVKKGPDWEPYAD